MSSYGAIDCETGGYILPSNALKGRNYKCGDCDQRVVLRQGNVRVHHFAHFNPSAKCKFYNTSPGESETHKHAKLLLQRWLNEKKPIVFSWICQALNKFGLCSASVDKSIEYKDGDEVVLEYRCPSGKFIADVAVINDGTVRYIIEVKHSHQTTTTCRPEPWFEVSANDIDEGCHYGETTIYLENCRINESRACVNCSVKQEKWVSSIPILHKRYGQERLWEQDVPCICCGRKKYSPEWIENRPRQVCKICLGNEPAKVRETVNRMIWD